MKMKRKAFILSLCFVLGLLTPFSTSSPKRAEAALSDMTIWEAYHLACEYAKTNGVTLSSYPYYVITDAGEQYYTVLFDDTALSLKDDSNYAEYPFGFSTLPDLYYRVYPDGTITDMTGYSCIIKTMEDIRWSNYDVQYLGNYHVVHHSNGECYPNLLTDVNLGAYEDQIKKMIADCSYFVVTEMVDGVYQYCFMPSPIYAGKNTNGYILVHSSIAPIEYDSRTGTVSVASYGAPTFLISNGSKFVIGSNYDYRSTWADTQSLPYNNLLYPSDVKEFIIPWYDGEATVSRESYKYYLILNNINTSCKTRVFLSNSPFYCTSSGEGDITIFGNNSPVKVYGASNSSNIRKNSSIYTYGTGSGNTYSGYYTNYDVKDTSGNLLLSANPYTPPEPPVTYDTAIDFTMNVTEVNVIVPLNVTCFINPNEENGFTYSDLSVINNSYAPVKLSLNVFKSMNEKQEFLLPDELNAEVGISEWENLSNEQSLKYFALGIRPLAEASGWHEILSEEYAYAGSVSGKLPQGVIAARSTAEFELTSCHGNSFKETQELDACIGFVAELCIE